MTVLLRIYNENMNKLFLCQMIVKKNNKSLSKSKIIFKQCKQSIFNVPEKDDCNTPEIGFIIFKGKTLLLTNLILGTHLRNFRTVQYITNRFLSIIYCTSGNGYFNPFQSSTAFHTEAVV